MKQTLIEPGGCFIKGTRVHTKEGLKPIEEIKVGDWILSSPEDGGGSPEYKRVVRTFEHERQTIVRISIHPEGWKSSDPFYFIVATGSHPFWVEGIGWTRADALQRQLWLRQSDGGRAFVGGVQPVYRTAQEGIGWITGAVSIRGPGRAFDYANYSVIAESEKKKYTYLPDEVLASTDPYLRVNVYNIEVEDFHTYYVGAKGFLVRSANCEGPEGAREGEGLTEQTLIELGKVPGATAKPPDTNNEIRSQAGEGFIKGTRVHTKEGLKP
ncbi:Hint domain-containing protein, partial [Pseudomonas sp. PIC25]|uniref:Hint domain-containing protein n=1 Tax=Pseudomonas sp. PIC25 TaxID=1958773 RepID=UPI002114AB9B